MSSRIARLRRSLAGAKVDGLLVTQPDNIRYLCGYSGSNGLLLVGPRAAWFYTDFRYAEQVKTEVTGCRTRVLARYLIDDFPVEHAAGIRRLGVEPAHLTLANRRLLGRRLKGVRLVPLREDVTLRLRRTKDPDEIKKIRRAQALTDRVFAGILPLVKPGAREQDLAAELTYRFMRAGGESAFDPIVASGPNAAKPHAGASSRRLRKGDVITFDIGARVDGYASDMTRTVFLGRPNPDLAEVYRIVFEAQRRALAAIRPGAASARVDAAARDYIRDAGYGPYFGHGLGHGVGLAVHERPGLSHIGKDVLAPGDVTTVEPGIYLPGLGGVRIEDLVHVTRTGCRNLTRSPKELVRL